MAALPDAKKALFFNRDPAGYPPGAGAAHYRFGNEFLQQFKLDKCNSGGVFRGFNYFSAEPKNGGGQGACAPINGYAPHIDVRGVEDKRRRTQEEREALLREAVNNQGLA